MPLRQPDGAEVDAHALTCGDQLGRAAADVEHDGLVADRAAAHDPAAGELRLLLAGEQPSREPVAPLDLAEKGLAVVGVTHRARCERQDALGAEPLELAAVVAEHVSHARERDRQELSALVDAFAEPRNHLLAGDLVHLPVADVRDEESRGVCPEIDDADAHYARC